jgi:hypothetical protein
MSLLLLTNATHDVGLGTVSIWVTENFSHSIFSGSI